jgi:hypothetical protein
MIRLDRPNLKHFVIIAALLKRVSAAACRIWGRSAGAKPRRPRALFPGWHMSSDIACDGAIEFSKQTLTTLRIAPCGG